MNIIRDINMQPFSTKHLFDRASIGVTDSLVDTTSRENTKLQM